MSTENLLIRLEAERDYRAVEELTRDAFWNRYAPGADEHYLLCQLRQDSSFIKELHFVACIDDQIVGSIVFTKCTVTSLSGEVREVISFGPISVSPALQKKGIGRTLIKHALRQAKDLGYSDVVIYGDPRYYGRLGFRAGEVLNITNSDGEFACCLLTMCLSEGPNSLREFGGGRFNECHLFETFANSGLLEYDESFPSKEKMETESQRDYHFLRSMTYSTKYSVF
jgi:putative acetyltransferase